MEVSKEQSLTEVYEGIWSRGKAMLKGLDIKAVSTRMVHASIAMTARDVEDNPVHLKQISADIL
ncbi:hypothetical protein [Caballeronia sp. M23-90]